MLKELLKKNRSYRGYDRSVPVTREQMLDMVDCARYAPFSRTISSSNMFWYTPVRAATPCSPAPAGPGACRT